MAPAHQLRLSLAGSEDGEAEAETCRAAKPWWQKTTGTSGPQGLNLTEPPGADPHAGWCGSGEWATTPPMPIEARGLASRSISNEVRSEESPFHLGSKAILCLSTKP